MRRDRHETIILLIVILVLSLGIGYAFISTTLNIDGVSDIDSANWDIHFANLVVSDGSVSGEKVTTPATIGNNGLTVSYHINLKEPGDKYIFTVDTVNAGSLDAIIENIIFKINGVEATQAPEYLAQYVLYEDYSPLNINQFLKAGDTKRIVVGLQYRTDLDPDQLPATNQSINITFGIVYSQAPKYNYLYTPGIYDTAVSINKYAPLPNNLDTYDNYNDAMNALGGNVTVRLTMVNGLVYEKAIGFDYGGQVYYLSDEMSYSTKKNILLNVFGNSVCHERDGFYCNTNSDYIISVYENGDVGATVGSRSCGLYAEQNSILCGNAPS